MISHIIDEAKKNGACDKVIKVTSWKSLASLFFSPQGQEFCEAKEFPTLKEWNEIKANVEASRYGIFINAGEMSARGRENLALIGDTKAKCYFSTPRKAHTIVLMHGAEAKVVATNYAVVRIVKIGKAKVEISTDKTARILW